MTFVILETPAPARMQRFFPSATVLSALVLAGLIQACGQARADADAIKSLVSREAAAINGKDMRALSEIWSQDKNILLFDVPPPGRFRGWDQIGRLWKDFFERVSDIHLVVSTVDAQTQGSLGYATYDWSMTGRLGSYALEDRGQATAIYRKEDGQWRLVHAHYSPVPPALAGQAASTGAPSPAAGAPAAPGATTRPGGASSSGTGSPAASPSPAAPPAGAASSAPGKASRVP